jgi:hypothetical protein
MNKNAMFALSLAMLFGSVAMPRKRAVPEKSMRSNADIASRIAAAQAKRERRRMRACGSST